MPANGADRRRPLLLLAIMVVDMFGVVQRTTKSGWLQDVRLSKIAK